MFDPISRERKNRMTDRVEFFLVLFYPLRNIQWQTHVNFLVYFYNEQFIRNNIKNLNQVSSKFSH